MGINRTNPDMWKADTMESVDFFNDWFISFAPKTFRETRKRTSGEVLITFKNLNYLLALNSSLIAKKPSVVTILRMCTCPPIARDRLSGLAGKTPSFVKKIESINEPGKLTPAEISSLGDLISVISKMLDQDLLSWVSSNRQPSQKELDHAIIVVADRLCGSVSDPIIRNAQEHRQLQKIKEYLERKGYVEAKSGTKYNEMQPGTFLFRTNVQVRISEDNDRVANIPVDVLIQKKTGTFGSLPLLIEAKSAGDFANVNKRRKEEAIKMQQLRLTFGKSVEFVLFLCGYFDSTYLGYEASEGIDWVWEHRMSDLDLFGI